MKNLIVGVIVFAVFGLVLFAAYFIKSRNQINVTTTSVESVAPTQTLLGGDKDEHGCIGSAGYSWCESKQKCLRVWEEDCEPVSATPSSDEREELIREIKDALIVKHGSSAKALNITISKVEGKYAQGGAGELGKGGGMWFAAKRDDSWKLVWDGNGIITCENLVDYPDFPASLIPQCYDGVKNEMTTR